MIVPLSFSFRAVFNGPLVHNEMLDTFLGEPNTSIILEFAARCWLLGSGKHVRPRRHHADGSVISGWGQLVLRGGWTIHYKLAAITLRRSRTYFEGQKTFLPLWDSCFFHFQAEATTPKKFPPWQHTGSTSKLKCQANVLSKKDLLRFRRNCSSLCLPFAFCSKLKVGKVIWKFCVHFTFFKPYISQYIIPWRIQYQMLLLRVFHLLHWTNFTTVFYIT